MKISVFYKIEQNPGLRNQVEAHISVRAELEKLRSELSLAKNENEKKITLRKIARLERFEKLGEQPGENKEAIGKILKGKTSENYLGSDLLSLKKRGIDIAPLVLVSEGNPESDLTWGKIDVGNKLIVNFGVNKELNANIGAGDILSPEIATIRVNGIEWVRKNTPRPGYYNGNKYLPVFDGDTIEIIKKWSLSEEDIKQANESHEKRWKKMRIADTDDYGDNKALTELLEDQSLIAEVQDRAKDRLEKRAKFKGYNPENRIKFIETFGSIVKKECSKYGIPERILVDNLFAKENSKFDPTAKNPYSSAHGFGQIINSTWRTIETMLWEDLDRHNPEDQIRATCAYLNYIKDLRNCTWWDAVVYYHTWPYFNDSNVQQAMAVNAPIVAHMRNTSSPTARDYIEGARKYYWISDFA